MCSAAAAAYWHQDETNEHVLHVDDSEQTYFVEQVCSFRAVMHFVGRWRGFVRWRRQLRATVHMLKKALGGELALLIGHFAFDSFRAPC